jgi:sec-independent protein translocase protein TatA
MFGTLGAQEMIVIFLLALLLFGPKKLPEIGRTIGKAITEFRRASNDLKSTFEREIKSLEQETESLKQVASEYQYDNNYNYDYSTYDSNSDTTSSSETSDSTAASTSTESASATEGAESITGVAPEGAIARGEETVSSGNGAGSHEHLASGSNAVPATSDHTA